MGMFSWNVAHSSLRLFSWNEILFGAFVASRGKASRLFAAYTDRWSFLEAMHAYDE